MKRFNDIAILLCLLTTILVVGACTEAYPTLEYENPSGSIYDLNKDDLTRRSGVLFFVNQQDLFTITTRGMGPFPPENLSDYSKGTIYVYAFRDGKNDSGSELLSYADLRNSAYATATPGWSNNNDGTDYRDCLVDGRDYFLGLPTHIVPGGSGELKYTYDELKEHGYSEMTNLPDFVCYYSNRYQETPYNFFAYYIDSLDQKVTGSNAHREQDRIYYDIEIDGRHDIMCGMAPPLRDVLDTRYRTQAARLNANERNTLLQGGYSKFAADRDIHPSIDMKHQLTKLHFYAYPADESCNNVVIRAVYVTCKYKGQLTVATLHPEITKPGVQFSDAKKRMPLMFIADSLKAVADDAGNTLDGYQVKYDPVTMAGKEWYERKSIQIGDGIILPSDSVYDITIEYNQSFPRVDGGPNLWSSQNIMSFKQVRIDNPKNPNDPNSKIFQPGNSYNILIAVYGKKEIQVFTTIEQWKDAGNVHVGPDDEW